MAQLTVPIKVELKDEIDVIRYLLDEIEEERRYNEEYDKAYTKATHRVEQEGGYFWNYMDGFIRSPRQSVINDDLKMIRRLCLKMKKEEK